MDLILCFGMELRLGAQLMHLERSDFIRGVHSLLISKDKNPQWFPARLEDVDDQTVDAMFEDTNGLNVREFSGTPGFLWRSSL